MPRQARVPTLLEVGNPNEIFIVDILGSVQPAAGQHGILNAGFHGVTEQDFGVEFVQFLQKTVSHLIMQITEIFAVVFRQPHG